jgi:chromosome segregation ATPase
MKNEFIKRMFILGIITLFTIPLFAQKPIGFEEMQCVFSHGEYPGFKLTIPEADYDVITKSWIKELEKGTKSKIAIEGSEYSIFGAQISEISENSLNIYSIIRSQDSTIVLETSIEEKPKEFISKARSEKEFDKVKDYLYQFGKKEYTAIADNQLKEQERKLKNLEKEMSSLENTKSRLEKDIVEEQNDILSNNDKIELLKNDASNINSQIGDEKEILLGLKDDEAKKEKEAQIKDLEKDKKKVLNEIESLQKKIVDCNSNIQTDELDIESNINAQKLKQAEVEKQKIVVEKATTKLNTIMSY